MKILPIKRTHEIRAHGWVWLFGLSAVEGLIALIYLFSLPADAENAFWLGLSTRRLALIAVLLAVSTLCALLAWASSQTGWRDRWLDPARRRALFNALMILMPVITILSGLALLAFLSLYRTSGEFRYFAYYERLRPLLYWLGLFGLQSTIWVAWAGNFHWRALHTQRAVFRSAAAALLVFMGLWLLIGLTGIGIIPDLIGWGAPAVPLLEWQIWLSLLVGTVFLVFLAFRGAAARGWNARLDLLVAAAVGLLAAGLWLSQPVHTAFFATAGRAPNFEIYPFSDGAYYGLYAHNVLIGNGFQGSQVPPRPFYIMLLSLFHALAGQSYEQVVNIQTLMLALFPVVLYFIGKELHSRPAGVIIALFAILRELTAMISSPIYDDASTSQLFFADLPSALVISLWALLVLKWLKAPHRPLLPLLVGGGIGLAMLFRTQSIFMLPAVLLLALLSLRGQWRTWLMQLGLIVLGLALMVAPWLWRNYQVTGILAFDDPKSQTAVVAQRYSLSEGSIPETEFRTRPGEEFEDYSERINQGIFQFLINNPLKVAGFVSAHLVNAEIDNLLLLPVRDGLNSPRDLVMPAKPFWQSWDGRPTLMQAALIALNLALLALGLGAAWARWRWAGLALLLMSISYNASHALARNSGLRYLLPVDWMVYSYAAVGLLQLTISALLVLGLPALGLKNVLSTGDELAPVRPGSNKLSLRTGMLVGLAFLLIGGLPPLIEQAFPRRYPLQSQAELRDEFLQKIAPRVNETDRAAIEQLLGQPGATVLKGRVLYPRFYAAGDGEPRTAKFGYEPLDFPRSLFLIASNAFNGLIMLRADQPPEYLPNAADVLVLGCDQSSYIEASMVVVLNQPGGISIADLSIPAQCPPIETD